MVDMLLEFMLGPMRGITDFYVENQMIFNSLIVGFTLYKIIFSKKKTESESAS
ncbi:hypothetical protein [Oceanobacillus halotolerans]|uniref:hypothetical protein n=1 Tax=Oceanobacillus halotolerans TaxID=2663380 RepID=UPI0013DAAECC|nr:hypothetical protein [Oceanobacillus halotolerans]